MGLGVSVPGEALRGLGARDRGFRQQGDGESREAFITIGTPV